MHIRHATLNALIPAEVNRPRVYRSL